MAYETASQLGDRLRKLLGVNTTGQQIDDRTIGAAYGGAMSAMNDDRYRQKALTDAEQQQIWSNDMANKRFEWDKTRAQQETDNYNRTFDYNKEVNNTNNAFRDKQLKAQGRASGIQGLMTLGGAVAPALMRTDQYKYNDATKTGEYTSPAGRAGSALWGGIKNAVPKFEMPKWDMPNWFSNQPDVGSSDPRLINDIGRNNEYQYQWGQDL
jgi:hypothetical protein